MKSLIVKRELYELPGLLLLSFNVPDDINVIVNGFVVRNRSHRSVLVDNRHRWRIRENYYYPTAAKKKKNLKKKPYVFR